MVIAIFLLLGDARRMSGQVQGCWLPSRLDSLANQAERQVDTIRDNDHALMAWVVPDYVRAVSRHATISGDSATYGVIRRYLSRILRATDRARGVMDFAGRSESVWGTFRNTTDSTRRIVYVAETARLASALVEGALALAERFGSDSLTRAAVTTADEALRSHNREWRDTPDSVGRYVVPHGMPFRYAGINQTWPVNMQALAGVALHKVGSANGDSLLLRRARMVYRAVEGSVLTSVGSDGHWDYWKDAPAGYPHHPDDIAHASFTAEFLALGPSLDPPRWAQVRAAVERSFGAFYPESLESTQRIASKSAGQMGTELARWVEWAPLSGHVQRVALSFGGSSALWPNAETYLLCSSIAYFHLAPPSPSR